MATQLNSDLVDQLVAGLPDAVITTDREGCVTRFNAAAERLYGVIATEVIGGSVAIFIPKVSRAALTDLHRRIFAGEAVEPFETTRTGPNGVEAAVSVSGTPIIGEDGQPLELMAIIRDVTAIAPGRMLEMFARLVSAAGSIITLDSDGRIASFNPASEALFQLRADAMIGQPATTLIADPEFIECILTGEATAPIQARHQLADGSWLDLRRSGSALYGTDNSIIGACVFSRDVTVELREHHERKHLERQVRRAFEEALVAMVVTDFGGKRLAINSAACRMFDRSRDELLNSTWDEFTHPDDVDGNIDARARTRLRGEADQHLRQCRYILPDGRVIWTDCMAAVIRDPEGSPLYTVLQFQDVTDRRREEARLRRQAQHDHLTGLLNRRGFLTVLDRHLTDIGRRRNSGAVLMVDLDNFKQHNDTHGHQAGDAVLVAVARCLERELRGSDATGRLGGDEFLVLLADADHIGAEDAAWRLLTQIAEATALATGQTPHPVTTSIGVACFDDAGQVTSEQIIDLADRAMYEAKGEGKNQFVTYRPPSHGGPTPGTIA